MDRRSYLSIIGGTVVVALSGCLGNGNDEEEDNEAGQDEGLASPEILLGEYYKAAETADIDRLAELLHSDSPEVVESPDDENMRVNEISIDLTDVETLDTKNDRMLVKTTIDVESDAEVETLTERWELRTENGEWRLWEHDAATPPKTVFTAEFDADARELDILVTGGESIEARRLSIQGKNIDQDGPWYELSSAEDIEAEISSGDRLTIGAETDFQVSVLWESGEWDFSAELHAGEGPDA